MHSLKVVSLLATLLLPGVSFSAGFVHIPKWHLVEMPSGITEACYAFEEAQQLAMLDIDLQTFAGLKLELPKLKKAHDDTVAAYTGQVLLLEQKNLELTAQRDELTRQLKVSEVARIKAETDVLGAAGWVVAGSVLLLAVGGVIVYGAVAAAK